MNKHYYVTQRVRLYGRSYEAGEVIEADEADVADLVGSVLRNAEIVNQAEVEPPTEPPQAALIDTAPATDADSDSQPPEKPVVKKAAPVVKKASATRDTTK